MSRVLQAGLFAGGWCLGAAAGVAIASSSRDRKQQPGAGLGSPPAPSQNPASAVSGPSHRPQGDASASGLPFFSKDILKYTQALPGPVADILEHTAYISAYDRRLRHPAWTAEHLTAQSLTRPHGLDSNNGRGDRKFSVFKEDERIPDMFRAKLADYFRSGYDRGHMVPAADAKSSQRAMDETFLLSNIAPQVGDGFNRDYWAYTEDFVRSLTKRFSDVYVYTVPLYLPKPDPANPGRWRVTYEVIGSPPNIAVPTHFAKVILAVGNPPSTAALPALQSSTSGASPPGKIGASLLGLRSASDSSRIALGAFVIPNAVVPDTVPLRTFAVPVEAVERASGLVLFPPAVKNAARSLCDCVPCEIVIRDWGDRKKTNTASSGPSKTLTAAPARPALP